MSWHHYRLLIREKNEKVRQLERQINTFSYEGLLSSNSNYNVVVDTIKKEVVKQLKDVIRDPYVL